MGTSVAGAGDVNGDGKADIIIGVPYASPGGLSNAGSAYIFSGATGALLYQKNGAAIGDNLGFSVAGVGDVNGDGKADFIMGSHNANPGGRSNAGSAYVYSGTDGNLFYQKDGAAAGDALGDCVAGAGDVNGDGKADFIVGAVSADPGGRTSAGSVYVYSGADGALLYQKDGAAAIDGLGHSVAGAGDVNGDGKADFIVGAFSADPGGLGDAGSAFVYSGATGNLLFQKNGAAAGDLLSWSVAGAGDVNTDGKADFIIGASNADPGGISDAGSAYVYSGATGGLLYQKDGVAAGDQLGYSVAGAGDVNGDGKADFIIGAHFADPGGRAEAGSAYLYSGATGLLFYQKDGAAAGDFLGSSVSGGGDVNGDGRTDFIIGAFGADPGGRVEAGSAFVYSLPAPPDPPVILTPIYQKNGTTGINLGFGVAGAGDVNGDGRADFITGAPLADPGGIDGAGSAFIYSGLTGALLYQKNGADSNNQLGISVAGAGDVNGDGKADFIIGASFADPGGLDSAGSAFVYSGADGSLLYQKDGASAGDIFGATLAGGGDVNGDGRADFIISAIHASPNSQFYAGSAFVYSGLDGSLLYQKDGPGQESVLGVSVDIIGDLNADGKSEFLISAPFGVRNGHIDAGSVYIYSGATGALFLQKDGAVNGDIFGSGAHGIGGDVNGDGKPDFIVGARRANPSGLAIAGSAFVYSGATGALLYQKDGAAGGDEFGFPVCGAGDVNGDGRADFIIGARFADFNQQLEAGSAYLYSGASGALLLQVNGTASNQLLGFSLSGAGDLNGDGKAEIIIGAPIANTSAGSVFIYGINRKPLLAAVGNPSGTEGQLLTFTVSASDSDGLLPMLSVVDTSTGMAFADTGNGGGKLVWTPQPYQVGNHTVRFIASDGFRADTQVVKITVLADTLKAKKNGANQSDQFGTAVAGGGDVDNDGVADYIIGAPFADAGVFGEAVVLADAGSAYVYSGKNDTLIYQINGTSPGERVGGSVGLFGDVNLDGTDDFIVGAPGRADSAGAVYVFSGATGDTLHIITGSLTGERVGGSVGIGGDINHDGHADFIIGAPGKNGSAGAAYVYSGDDGSLLFQKTGGSSGDRVGGSVGIFDVYAIIGAPGVNNSAGTVFIDSGAGGTPVFQKSGSGSGDRVGGSVGIYENDFIVGAPGTNNSAGSAYVYSLSSGNLRYQVNGSSPSDRVGGSVGISADVNLDGSNDFVIGAPGKNDSAGAVFVYSGLDGLVLFQNFGDSTGERVGGSVGIFENANGTEPRILVGAPGADPNNIPDAGSAFIFQTEKKGDLNRDGLLTSVDVVHMLNCVFLGQSSAGINCGNLSLTDLSCDGLNTSVDVVREINAVFLGASTACSF